MEPLIPLNAPLPDVLHVADGEIRVKGSRITLYHILSAYQHHWIGPEMMVFHYPTLSLYQIEKVFEFYHANRAAADEYMKAYQAEIDHQRATGKTLDVAELRRRYEAKYGPRKPPAEANGAADPKANHPAAG